MGQIHANSENSNSSMIDKGDKRDEVDEVMKLESIDQENNAPHPRRETRSAGKVIEKN